MKIRRALILYKKSAYEAQFGRYRRPSLRKSYRSGDAHLEHFKRSHDVHYRSLERVKRALEERGIAWRAVPRGRSASAQGFDLVVALGGDGTFLEAARGAGRQPIVGVNSDPAHSRGRFCATDAFGFARALDRLLAGKAKLARFERMKVSLNGKPLGFGVVNDVLVCHGNPAAMSHYVVRLNGRSEHHRSSGMWIATAAGSSGGILSAGGKRLRPQDRRFQYVPRELYRVRAGYRLKGGLLGAKDRLSLRSLMPEGVIYVDGAHLKYAFGYGEVLTIGRSASPLTVLAPRL